MKQPFLTIVISDVHLGIKDSKAKELTRFLKYNTCKTRILNGDIIDGIHHLNSGDLVESLTALTESFDRVWNVVHNTEWEKDYRLLKEMESGQREFKLLHQKAS